MWDTISSEKCYVSRHRSTFGGYKFNELDPTETDDKMYYIYEAVIIKG